MTEWLLFIGSLLIVAFFMIRNHVKILNNMCKNNDEIKQGKKEIVDEEIIPTLTSSPTKYHKDAGLRKMPNQADHYIIRMLPPAPADPQGVIDRVLQSNGYVRGTATVDFRVDGYAMNDAYMTALAFFFEKSGAKVDYGRSKVHNFKGAAKGTLMAIFLERM